MNKSLLICTSHFRWRILNGRFSFRHPAWIPALFRQSSLGSCFSKPNSHRCHVRDYGSGIHKMHRGDSQEQRYWDSEEDPLKQSNWPPTSVPVLEMMVCQFQRNTFQTYFSYADYPVGAGEVVAMLVTLKQVGEPFPCLLVSKEVEWWLDFQP